VTDQGELEQRLQRVLEAHGLLGGALITASGEIITRIGDFAGLMLRSGVSKRYPKLARACLVGNAVTVTLA
jgi:hypothetical protein